jgi:hypothetical protein
MKAKIVMGKLEIDLSELVESLSPEEKASFARTLVANDYLFAGVLQCVTDDSRYVGHYFTDDPDGEWWFDARKVLELREKLVPLMPSVAQGAVLEALRQRNAAQEQEKRMSDWAWKLYHRWPPERLNCRPNLPDGWKPPREPEPGEVEAMFAGTAATK